MNFLIVDQEPAIEPDCSISSQPDVSSQPVVAAKLVSVTASQTKVEHAEVAANAAREQALREQRWSERVPFGRSGFIGIGPEGDAIACCVRNISRYGALIEVDVAHSAEVPESFVLTFMNNRIRSEANCLLRWRSDASVGVTFAGPVRTVVMRDSN